MTRGTSGPGSCVIVVGDPNHESVREMVRQASEFDAEIICCDDVYAAVAAAARAAGRRAAIVGRISELTKAKARLFDIVSAGPIRCCGLLDQSVPANRDDVLKAMQIGVRVTPDVRAVRFVLQEWFLDQQDPGECFHRPGLSDDEWRATEAELDALLGPERDG